MVYNKDCLPILPDYGVAGRVWLAGGLDSIGTAWYSVGWLSVICGLFHP